MHNVKHPSLIIQENILYLIYSSIEELSEKFFTGKLILIVQIRINGMIGI